MTGLCVEEASWQTSAARESSRSSGNYRVQDILERQFQLIQNLTMMPSAASIAETSKEYSHVAEVNPIASAREGSQGEERITEFAMSLSTTSPRREVQVYSESDVRVSSLSLRREVACAVRVRAVSHPQRQADSGSFFYFDEARWSEMISAPSHEEWNGRQYNVAQTRDGMLVWSGKVVVCWTSHFGAYGHRAAYCALGQWQIGDVITIHTVEQATAATGKDAGAYPLERERSAITTVVPEKRYTTVVELDAAVRGIVLLEKVPDEPEASLDAELRVPQQETAPPIASIGLDTNLDGKIDTYITGVDRNHDGIPDFIQKDNHPVVTETQIVRSEQTSALLEALEASRCARSDAELRQTLPKSPLNPRGNSLKKLLAIWEPKSEANRADAKSPTKAFSPSRTERVSPSRTERVEQSTFSDVRKASSPSRKPAQDHAAVQSTPSPSKKPAQDHVAVQSTPKVSEARTNAVNDAKVHSQVDNATSLSPDAKRSAQDDSALLDAEAEEKIALDKVDYSTFTIRFPDAPWPPPLNFKKELLKNMEALGLHQVATLSVEQHLGSTVSVFRAPHVAIQQLQQTSLNSFKVLGYNAEALEECNHHCLSESPASQVVTQDIANDEQVKKQSRGDRLQSCFPKAVVQASASDGQVKKKAQDPATMSFAERRKQFEHQSSWEDAILETAIGGICRLKKGDRVITLANTRSVCNAEIKKGIEGVVKRNLDDGDVQIKFDGIDRALWISGENRKKLSQASKCEEALIADVVKEALQQTDYTVMMSVEGWSKARTYLDDLRVEKEQPSHNLLKQIGRNFDFAQIDHGDLVRHLLHTKLPQSLAETSLCGDGSDWNLKEISILGDVSFAIPVTIFDNGAHVDPVIHSEPFEGTLLYICDALFDSTSADWQELVAGDLTLDQQAYLKFYERRMLPCFQYANDCAIKLGRRALITIPSLGCGKFVGRFEGTLGHKLDIVLKQILQKHGAEWPGIHVVYFDVFGESAPTREIIKGSSITYIVQQSGKNGSDSRNQLCPPQDYEGAAGGEGDDFSQCYLFSFVALDHVSWPGYDYWDGSRETDDGAKGSATDSMYRVTGVEGRYDAKRNKYVPPDTYASWSAVLKTKNIRLDLSSLKETAPPIATIGLDTNLDGKIDTYIIGVDRNHDGIPDFIQQQVDKPRLSLIEHLSIMKDTSVADIATALGSITGYNRMRLETALNDIDSSTALGLRLEEAKQAVADMDSLFCEMDGLFNASPGFSQSEHHQFGVEQCVDFVDAINSYHDSEISDHEATRRQKAQIDKAEKVNTTTLQSKREEEKVARKKAEEEEKLRMHAEQVAHAWKQAAGSEDHESSIQSKSHDRKPDKGGDQLEAVPAHSLAAHSQQSSHEAREEEAEKEEKQKKDAHHKVEELAEKLRMQAEREVRTNAEDDARLKAGEEEEANRRKAENARLKAEEEEEEASRRKAENTRLKAEEEEANRRKAENEARARKEDLQEELRMQAERETKTNAEYDARLKIEEEMDRRRIEDEARARAEEQARSRCDSVPLGQEHRTMSMLVNVGDDIVVDASDAAATPLRTADVASSSDKITETPPVARGDDLARTEHAAQPDSCTLADERNPKIDVLETPQRIHVEKFDHSKTYVIENYRANGKYLNWNSAQNSKSVSVLLQSNPDHASSHWRIRMVEGGCAIEPRELAPSRFLCLQHKAEPGFLGPDVHQKEGCIQLCNDATQPSSTWHIAKTPITDVYTIENANAKGNYITVTEAYATSGANTQIGRNPEDPSARWRISEHRVEHRIAPQAPAAIHQESAPAEESPSKRSCCWCCRRKPKEEERRPISATTPTAPSAARTAATGAANTEAARKTPEASSTVHKTPDSSRGATEPKPAAVISQRSQQAIGRPATSIQNREHIAIPVRPEAEDDQGDDEWQ